MGRGGAGWDYEVSRRGGEMVRRCSLASELDGWMAGWMAGRAMPGQACPGRAGLAEPVTVEGIRQA